MDLYTAIVLITITMLAVSVVDILSNRIINRDMRRNSVFTCLLIALAVFFEWVAVKTNGADISWSTVHKLAKLAEFCLSPLIGVMATASYGKIRRPKLIAALSAVHVLFEIIALHYGLVIRIDEANIYHRGKLYPVYIVIFSVSIIFCIVSAIRSELEHYSRPSWTMSATLAFLILGIGIQMIHSELRVDYLCVAISNYFLYNQRCKMILQLDGLTHLLNRRRYEKDLDKVNPPAVILLMDINNFKKLNDSYGHAAGDHYLQEVAGLIHSVYGKYGTCYRYGGDEFCVIMTRRTDDAEKCITLFQEQIREKQLSDKHFPGVSVGYARYSGESQHIRAVLAEADEMMYKVKKQQKLN